MELNLRYYITDAGKSQPLIWGMRVLFLERMFKKTRHAYVSLLFVGLGHLIITHKFLEPPAERVAKQRLCVVSSIQFGLSPWLVKVSQKMWVMIRFLRGESSWLEEGSTRRYWLIGIRYD